MKILESQSAVLSNFDVLSHIEQSRVKPRTPGPQHTNVQTVLKEVCKRLSPDDSRALFFESYDVGKR